MKNANRTDVVKKSNRTSRPTLIFNQLWVVSSHEELFAPEKKLRLKNINGFVFLPFAYFVLFV